MKIYMSIDMEGMPGTFSWAQEEAGDRAKVREYIYMQMEWILDGIRASSKNSEISEIIIADSHYKGDNLHYSFTELDERITLISGRPRSEYMMPGLDKECDVVFFVGYHSGVGALHGAMDHTYSGGAVHNIWINGKQMNESFINAAYAGYLGIPVGLVVGDRALIEELFREDAMPWVKFVETKEAIGKFSSKLRSIGSIKRDTIEAVKSVLDGSIKDIPLYKFEPPINLKIEFNSTSMVDSAAIMPYVNRIDGRTLEFIDYDYKTVFNAIMALVGLASLSRA